jgi:hypothetical protein
MLTFFDIHKQFGENRALNSRCFVTNANQGQNVRPQGYDGGCFSTLCAVSSQPDVIHSSIGTSSQRSLCYNEQTHSFSFSLKLLDLKHKSDVIVFVFKVNGILQIPYCWFEWDPHGILVHGQDEVSVQWVLLVKFFVHNILSGFVMELHDPHKTLICGQ